MQSPNRKFVEMMQIFWYSTIHNPNVGLMGMKGKIQRRL